jgi:glycine/D-amino acid oxidase-like deaminating enzyme
MRVAVIGTGVIGASVGWHLSRRGADVLFLDRGTPGAGVTDWTFSWVNASNKTQTREYFELNVAGMSAHRRLAAQFGADGWWHPTGHLRWAGTTPDGEALREKASQLASWGYDVELWEAAKVRRLLEPAVRFPADDTPVAVFPHEGWIDGRALTAKLVGDTLRSGARAMRYEPGLVARLHCGDVPIGRAMHTPHVELRPGGGGRLVVHSREIDSRLSSHGAFAPELATDLHALALDVLPTLAGSAIVGARAMSRPIPGDGFPSVGALDGIPGYYEAIAHSGITLAAVIGEVLALEITGGEISPLISPYRPGRLA